jgi:hypothetical protein
MNKSTPVLPSTEVTFHCYGCGAKIYTMDVNFSMSLDGAGIVVTPSFCFLPKESEIDHVSPTNEVHVHPCRKCKEVHENSTIESIAEEIESPIERALKSLAGEVENRLKVIELVDQMVEDTMAELSTSIESFGKSAPDLKETVKEIREKVKAVSDSIMEDVEGFKDR